MEEYQEQSYYITGCVFEKEYQNEQWTLHITVKSLQTANEVVRPPKKSAHLKLILKANSYVPKIGETIELYGSIKLYHKATNPGEFNLRFYYAIQGLDGYVDEANIISHNRKQEYIQEKLCHKRYSAATVLNQILPSREAGVMKAILLGMKSEMNQEQKDLYRRSGIAHILAISGLHISLIGMGIYGLLRKTVLPSWIAAAICILLLLLYGIMTGMSSSAFRAIIMFSLKVIADCRGRTYDMPSGMAFAASLLLLKKPMYIYDCGFLLSFCAILGCACIYPVLSQLLLPKYNRPGIKHPKIRNIVRAVLQSLMFSASIQLATLPVILYFYYEVPLLSVFMNLCIIPLMSIVMILGISGLLVGIISIPTGIYLIFPIRIIFTFFDHVCNITDYIPGTVLITGRPEGWQIAAYYLLISVLLIGLDYRMVRDHERKYKFKRAVRPVSIILILVCLFLLLWNGRTENKIFFLDVGQGDAICILTKDNKCILIDGGSTSSSEIGKYVLIPFLKFQGVSRVDYSIITHPDEDHISGIIQILTEQDQIKIDNLLMATALKTVENEGLAKLLKQAKEADTTVSYISTGTKLYGSEVTMYVLHPETMYQGVDMNSYSTTLLLTTAENDMSVLLTGDISSEEETLVMQQLKWLEASGDISSCKAYVLKVAHHGSKYSTCPEFLDLICPRIAVISCSENNERTTKMIQAYM